MCVCVCVCVCVVLFLFCFFVGIFRSLSLSLSLGLSGWTTQGKVVVGRAFLGACLARNGWLMEEEEEEEGGGGPDCLTGRSTVALWNTRSKQN